MRNWIIHLHHCCQSAAGSIYCLLRDDDIPLSQRAFCSDCIHAGLGKSTHEIYPSLLLHPGDALYHAQRLHPDLTPEGAVHAYYYGCDHSSDCYIELSEKVMGIYCGHSGLSGQGERLTFQFC